MAARGHAAPVDCLDGYLVSMGMILSKKKKAKMVKNNMLGLLGEAEVIVVVAS